MYMKIEVLTYGSKKFLASTLNKPWLRMKPFQTGILSRTPEHYKKFVYEWKVLPPTPFFFKENSAKYEYCPKTNLVQKVQNIPPPIVIPDELDNSLLGGEGVVEFISPPVKKRGDHMPRYFMPRISMHVVHSEILEKYIKIMATQRAMTLIDEHKGLDNYIMDTTPADLATELAVKLRRELLLALGKDTHCPNDAELKEKLLDKHKHHLLPLAEADWYGLSLSEACTKQERIEKEANKISIPYKVHFRQELIQYMKDKKDQVVTPEQTSILSQWNPFSKTK